MIHRPRPRSHPQRKKRFDCRVVLRRPSPISCPFGSTLTFSPTSVTPALGGSASSQLNVALGPSVLPGSCSVTVTGTASPLVHSTPLDLTVVASPAGVSQVISTITALGCIDSAGVASAFKAKLAQAQAAIDAGDTQTAINLLTALLAAEKGPAHHAPAPFSPRSSLHPGGKDSPFIF